MATKAYTIYSHYDPEDREALERETGQIQDSVDEADRWEAEARTVYKRRITAPHFVPASYSDWSSLGASSSKQTPSSTPRSEDDVADWYRSLTSRTSTPVDSAKPRTPSLTSKAKLSSEVQQSKKLDKNNWFIQNVQSTNIRPSNASSSSTLADILARDPPPLPSEEQFRPPVFLAIGPANKGFAMLEKSGWNEGEALGRNVIRRSRRLDLLEDIESDDERKRKRKRTVKQEEVEVATEDADVKELRQVSVIDLTLSDSDDESCGEEDVKEETVDEKDTEATVSEVAGSSTIDQEASESGRKALIVPISTVLKNDRLGLGLKAKTEGPYKSSVKRITHNVAALANHLLNAEEARERKSKFGRGRRGLAREYKQEQLKRQEMMAYMNS
ncbi:hypothetical protein D9758_002770 [Tetrapyrgos nigripes]|uniref:G-patch domain-containing protein n=1 Tax=Tetrapyrgos nigripes TaxID=182062 RepID=A0A8H5LU79_9AGAR|nr:hypothetical protein D9758_002770 [Tetrapyrgos nigripes]